MRRMRTDRPHGTNTYTWCIDINTQKHKLTNSHKRNMSIHMEWRHSSSTVGLLRSDSVYVLESFIRDIKWTWTRRCNSCVASERWMRPFYWIDNEKLDDNNVIIPNCPPPSPSQILPESLLLAQFQIFKHFRMLGQCLLQMIIILLEFDCVWVVWVYVRSSNIKIWNRNRTASLSRFELMREIQFSSSQECGVVWQWMVSRLLRNCIWKSNRHLKPLNAIKGKMSMAIGHTDQMHLRNTSCSNNTNNKQSSMVDGRRIKCAHTSRPHTYRHIRVIGFYEFSTDSIIDIDIQWICNKMRWNRFRNASDSVSECVHVQCECQYTYL